jgi:hypothetical protein
VGQSGGFGTIAKVHKNPRLICGLHFSSIYPSHVEIRHSMEPLQSYNFRIAAMHLRLDQVEFHWKKWRQKKIVHKSQIPPTRLVS